MTSSTRPGAGGGGAGRAGGRQPRHGPVRAGRHPPGSQPPHFDDAALAIDALGALVEGLDDRLGEAAPVLRDALQQIRLGLRPAEGCGGARGTLSQAPRAHRGPAEGPTWATSSVRHHRER